MKRSVLVVAITGVISASMLLSCSGEDKSEETHQSDHMHTTEYYCPMKCEGEKTYKEQGDCPVCGMSLVEKE
jgi:Cu2+-exporting ATPase